jgi:pyruvate-formate lyase-activating enzyme
MGFAVAGLRGGIGRNSVNSFVDPFVWDLLSGKRSATDLESFLRSAHFRKTLTVTVNNRCNLNCRHCYLQVPELAATELSLDEWEVVAHSAFGQAKLELVCITGKEVLFNSQSIAVLKTFASAQKAVSSRIRLGLITNGTLLRDQVRTLLDCNLDYIDVSIDGTSSDHDFVRGSGSFARTAEGIRAILPNLGSRLFGAITLQSRNVHHLAALVEALDHLGLMTIGISWYHRQSYTDQGLGLGESDYDRVFQGLQQLGRLSLRKPMTILFELDATTAPATEAFLRSEWFSPASFGSDSRGELFSEFGFENGLTLQFRLTPYPSIVFRSARLTCDGYYLAAEDVINMAAYAGNALGNIRNHGGDLYEMHSAVVKSTKISALIREYWTEILPKFRRAYLTAVSCDPIDRVLPHAIV